MDMTNFKITPETMMQATAIVLGCSNFAYPIRATIFEKKVPFNNLRGKNEYEGKLAISCGFDIYNISIDFELNVIRLDDETFDAELSITIHDNEKGETISNGEIVKNISLDIIQVKKLFIKMYNIARSILSTKGGVEIPTYNELENIAKEFESRFKRRKR